MMNFETVKSKPSAEEVVVDFAEMGEHQAAIFINKAIA